MRINSQSAGNYLNIIELYNQGLSIKQVAEKLNIGKNLVYNNLVKYNIKRRPSCMALKPIFTEDYFEVIDSEDKAYWLGFIAADGYVNKTGYLRVELAEKDKTHLEKLCLNLNYPIERIRKREEKNTYYLHVFSVKLYNSIKDIKNPQFAKTINKDLQKDFVRGFFDGDGSLWFRGKNSIPTAIICSLEMSQVLTEIVPIKFNKLTHVKSCDMYRLRTEGIQTSLNFLSYIYDNSTTFLERKKSKYTNYVQDRASTTTISPSYLK